MIHKSHCFKTQAGWNTRAHTFSLYFKIWSYMFNWTHSQNFSFKPFTVLEIWLFKVDSFRTFPLIFWTTSVSCSFESIITPVLLLYFLCTFIDRHNITLFITGLNIKGVKVWESTTFRGSKPHLVLFFANFSHFK